MRSLYFFVEQTFNTGTVEVKRMKIPPLLASIWLLDSRIKLFARTAAESPPSRPIVTLQPLDHGKNCLQDGCVDVMFLPEFYDGSIDVVDF